MGQEEVIMFGQEKTSIRDLYSNQWDRRRLSVWTGKDLYP
jgi:hypothetical protein